MAHNIAMRFKDNASKFSGDIGEAWMEYVAEYQRVARDYNLTPTQKLQFLHNLLRGDAKRFFLDRVDNYVSNFTQAVENDQQGITTLLYAKIASITVSVECD